MIIYLCINSSINSCMCFSVIIVTELLLFVSKLAILFKVKVSNILSQFGLLFVSIIK